MNLKRIIISLFLPRPWLAWVLLLIAVIAIALLPGAVHLKPIIQFLDSDSASFLIGDVRLSPYLIIKGGFIVLTMFWVSSIALGFLEEQVGRFETVSSNTRTLFLKIIQFIVYFLLFILSLKFLGIDLTAFAVVGGAVGIGIGFGLQKITSNYISGVILLLEGTIEEGDLVELGDGTFGFVRQNSARFTLIEAFDGKEIMVPNEDFITNRVVNWTYSNKKGRVSIPIGVSYKSDIKKARALILEAANEHPRCLADPAPECYLREYGDSSVNFLLFFWVDNMIEGRYKPQSEVMLSIWDKFKDNDISIPFPQRDIHIIDKHSH